MNRSRPATPGVAASLAIEASDEEEVITRARSLDSVSRNAVWNPVGPVIGLGNHRLSGHCRDLDMISYLMVLNDRRDERLARVLRDRLGRDCWLVSWFRLGRRRWLARLSCEEIPETIEETGRTRCEAIAMAELCLCTALGRLPKGIARGNLTALDHDPRV